MPKADCCGKELKDCKCSDRSRSGERRQKEAKEAKDKAAAEEPPAWALSMQQNLLKGLRGVVKEELKPVQDDLEKVKKTVAAVEGRVAQVEAEVKKNGSVDEEKWEQRIKDMETKLSTINSKVSEDSSTLLFGGLQDMTFSDAEKWIKGKIKENNLEEPGIVYHKGEDFSGIAFATFTSEKVAEDIARKLSAKLKDGEEAVYCKKDLPLEKRVPLSLLLGLRRQLIDWGFARSKVRVKEESNSLSVGGTQILTAAIDSNRLVIDWKSQDWKEWNDFVGSSEFKKLVEKAEKSLKSATDDKGKGDGKGKKGY